MGNHVSRAMAGCFVPGQNPSLAKYHQSSCYSSNAVFLDHEPFDEGLGHSFCYIRPSLNNGYDVNQLSSSSSGNSGSDSGSGSGSSSVSVSGLISSSSSSTSSSTSIFPQPESAPKTHSETTFKAISGASVSANASTPCSIAVSHQQQQHSLTHLADQCRAAAFECTASFSSLPLQPIPKGYSSTFFSGPIAQSDKGIFSGPIERSGCGGGGFMSGPLERSCISGPIDSAAPLDRSQYFSAPLPASYVKSASGSTRRRISSLIGAVSKPMKKALHATNSAKCRKSQKKRDGLPQLLQFNPVAQMEYSTQHNLQWAHGKAGEDRVHVVLSDKHGWLFVGIYDGFNGPDAPDFLMGNLYTAVYKELQGLLWDKHECFDAVKDKPCPELHHENGSSIQSDMKDTIFSGDIGNTEQSKVIKPNLMSAGPEKSPVCNGRIISRPSKTRRGNSFPTSYLGSDKENHVNPERHEDFTDKGCKPCKQNDVNHSAVLKALEIALEKTEKAYLDMADKALKQNPELALMGSCILVMLMKDEDVYIMNVGDSRAIVAQHRNCDGPHHSQSFQGLASLQNTGGILDTLEDKNTMFQLDLTRVIEGNALIQPSTLGALQLSKDHSTNIGEEVNRIKAEHPDDEYSILNDRVKGTLKVTRAFGAGFLKKPQWNNAILEMFRIDYVGSAPYISCTPSIHHHRLGQDDRFIILSSDGLYQYLSNQEAVWHVDWFMEKFPDGDPAQHLIEELLFRAAKKAGMDFHELLDIPQGERRKYHDDVSVMVISLQGRIWKCSS